jgi:hypothetical protein
MVNQPYMLSENGVAWYTIHRGVGYGLYIGDNPNVRNKQVYPSIQAHELIRKAGHNPPEEILRKFEDHFDLMFLEELKQ